MASESTTRPAAPRKPAGQRGALARPLDALVFLAPMMLLFGGAALLDDGWLEVSPDRVTAYALVKQFLRLFGPVAAWAPAGVVTVILLATHAASRQPWRVHWGQVAWMYVEACLFALPLLLLNRSMPLAWLSEGSSALVTDLALGVGAGVYEELLFRLVFISFMVLLGADLLRLDRGGVAVAAVILSALLFAAHHHQPLGAEPFTWGRFVFRSLAGTYLAVIFWYRGYGPAAGCHAAYNVIIVALSAARS